MQTIELAQQLIKLNKSIPGREKDTAVKLIAETMEKNGFHVEIIQSNGVKNVVGSSKGRKEKTKKLIFNGHYDTVPPSSQWTVNPFNPEIKNGELWGLGSCDMTANLAAMITATCRLAKENLKGEIIVAAVGDEEVGGHNGTKATISHGVVGDYAVIGEPTTMRLATGHKARVQIELTANGKGGHAAYPPEGKNAIQLMAKAISILESGFPLRGKHYEETYEYMYNHPTMSVGLINGGTAANVIAAECKAIVDFRLPPARDREEFIKKINRKVAIAGDVTVNVQFNENGWMADENSAYVKMAKEALKKATGKKVEGFMHKLGASDARFYHAAKIPVINVGAGQMHLHVPDEKIELKQVEQVEKFYYELGRKIIG